jgi:hypothetical protein
MFERPEKFHFYYFFNIILLLTHQKQSRMIRTTRVFLVQMTFEFKIKNTIVFSIVLERKYELTVLNLNSKIMSKHIFPHFYSLEAPVLRRPHRR